MKKIVILAFLFATTTTTFAQKVVFGVKAGANVSNFTGGNFDAVDKKALVGFHGGAYLNFSFAGFAVQPELMVSTQGAKIDSVSGSYDWKVTYVTLPVMAQYRSPGGFFLEAGPQVGFKISDNIENKTIENFAKDLDLSAAIGAGIQTKKGLGVGIRYLAGLSKVGDFEATDVLSPDFKNSVLQVGISFPLGK